MSRNGWPYKVHVKTLFMHVLKRPDRCRLKCCSSSQKAEGYKQACIGLGLAAKLPRIIRQDGVLLRFCLMCICFTDIYLSLFCCCVSIAFCQFLTVNLKCFMACKTATCAVLRIPLTGSCCSCFSRTSPLPGIARWLPTFILYAMSMEKK